MAYAITSYQCAWFLTYYPEEWVASYLDFATDGKGKTASGDDPKSVALVEAQMLGFRFGKPDINFSEDKFAVKEGRLLIPSFSAIKGVGKASLIEIRQHRPYVNLRDLILNKDGTWRHSKFNKKALSHLIKTSAFESMDLVGPGKTFDNYKQMHTVLIENHENLKRIASRKTKNDANAELEALVKSVKASITEDWTIEEKTEFSKELTGQIDASLLLTKKITDFFLQNNIESIDGFAGPSKLHWAIVDSCSQLETKFGKPFLLLTFHGESGAKRKCKVWNFNPDRDVLYKKDDILVLRMEKDDFGLSTKPSSVRILKKKT
jgi:DNA polymerase III alpha subunit